MSALHVQHQGFAEIDFQETCPSFKWAPLPRSPFDAVARLAAAPGDAPRVPPEAVSTPWQSAYRDPATAAWLEDDDGGRLPAEPFDDADRQQWALVRLVCGAALALSALALASHLLG
jgi:hypothetical protein